MVPSTRDTFHIATGDKMRRDPKPNHFSQFASNRKFGRNGTVYHSPEYSAAFLANGKICKTCKTLKDKKGLCRHHKGIETANDRHNDDHRGAVAAIAEAAATTAASSATKPETNNDGPKNEVKNRKMARKSAADEVHNEKTSMSQEHNEVIVDLKQKLRTTKREANIRKGKHRREKLELSERYKEKLLIAKLEQELRTTEWEAGIQEDKHRREISELSKRYNSKLLVKDEDSEWKRKIQLYVKNEKEYTSEETVQENTVAAEALVHTYDDSDDDDDIVLEKEPRDIEAEIKIVQENFNALSISNEAETRAPLLMRTLNEDEREIVETAIDGVGPGDEIVAQAGTDSVQRASMQTLKPGIWLNDEIIHYFYLLLAKRDEDLCKFDPSRKRSHFFKSFFITNLLNEGNASCYGKYEYRNVKRWSKKVPGKDIFNLDKILFPINIGKMHWICAAIFMKKKRIEIFDSMGSNGNKYLRALFRYIQDEHLDKKKTPLPNADSWELVSNQLDTPRQANGYDCGVFTCMFADFLLHDAALVFNQDHIDQCRERIALSIMKDKAIM